MSLIATRGPDVIGYVAIVWESDYAGFRSRGIPLVHQITVAGPFRQRRVATLLMEAAEQLAHDRGIVTLGITVGLFDEYGPAQRLYGRRGYIPDGRGACRGQEPLRKGMQVTIDDDLIIWLTKDLGPGRSRVEPFEDGQQREAGLITARRPAAMNAIGIEAVSLALSADPIVMAASRGYVPGGRGAPASGNPRR